MTDFTNLLAQITSSSAECTTLADTLRKHAKDYSDSDLEILVSGLRTQREQWNLAQRQGAKTRITAKSIKVEVPTGLAGFTFKPPVI